MRTPPAWLCGLGQEPSPDAHLATVRGRYTHHGLYVGGGQVVHYAGLSREWAAGPVEEVSLAQFADGHRVWVIEHHAVPFSGSRIVQRARSRLGERRYRVLTNNCEHFCNWRISGCSRSPQIKRPALVPPLAMFIVHGLAFCLSRLVAG